MVFWLIHIAGLLLAWHYTDLSSESILQSSLLPLLIVGLLISVMLKLAVHTHGSTSSSNGSSGGFFDSPGGGNGGGDGGCGGDGGGC